jgi:hypothetical protein
MEEVPDSWASILNPQYLKSITEFQDTVKYHEETLAKLESPMPLQQQHLPRYLIPWVNPLTWRMIAIGDRTRQCRECDSRHVQIDRNPEPVHLFTMHA